ncbi:hypothetical protein HU830_05215 [Lactobacillus sp. DCY120]|uniref:Cell wall-active antibiotics response LiaF-like C-terminal domain-containing protein n=1 Tax=Bombilactobacillus apium TaxID=2675299 RepID=A0A850QXL8_9LACO|nr:hypothetical protein [Bombilactobacillus apium]NVY96564.1 hypothetical protein [Bombilactobacillus apium]
MKRSRRYFWGIIFILLAFLLLLNQIIDLPFLGSGKFISTAVLLVIFLWGWNRRLFEVMYYAIAFFIIFNADTLHLGMVSPFILFIVAVLLQAGLSILLAPWLQRYRVRSWTPSCRSGKSATTEETVRNAEVVNIDALMMSSMRYLPDNNFRKLKIDTVMSSLKIYLTSEKPTNDIIIDLDVVMGHVELFLPRDCQVIDETVPIMGSTTSLRHDPRPAENPRIYIRGEVIFGNLSWHYL